MLAVQDIATGQDIERGGGVAFGFFLLPLDLPGRGSARSWAFRFLILTYTPLGLPPDNRFRHTFKLIPRNETQGLAWVG